MANFVNDFRKAYEWVIDALAAFDDHNGQPANRARAVLTDTLATLEDVAHQVVQISTDVNDVTDLIGGTSTATTPTTDQVFANQSPTPGGGVIGNPQIPESDPNVAILGLLESVSDRLNAIEARLDLGHEYHDTTAEEVPDGDPLGPPTPDPTSPVVPVPDVEGPQGSPQDPPPGVQVDPAPSIGTTGTPGDSTPGAGV